MVLYLQFTYGSQLSEEKNRLEICLLVPEIFNKYKRSIFFGTPCSKRVGLFFVILHSKSLTPTGCSLMILGKYQVTKLARKQPVSLKWCQLLPFPSPFWYLVSKELHNYLGIIHTWRLLRGITVKIYKIHRRLRIKETSVLFCKYLRSESPDLYEIWD